MNETPPAFFWLYQTAFILQLPAVLLFVSYAFKPKRALALAATALLAASLLVHVLFTALLAASAGRLPLASGFEAISAWGLALTALVVEVEWRHRLGLLGAFLAPLSAATLLMGFRFALSADLPVPGLGDAWLLSHVALAMLSYAFFTAAAGAAGAYLVQDRQLKSKRMGALFYELPPLGELEALLARLAGAGLLALCLAIAAGYVWRLRLGLPLASTDPKIGFSLGMAAAYAVGLAARLQGPLRGRRFAWLCVLLFLALFFGVYLVDLYFGGHAFLRPGGA
jgi:ABC-type transport system involved in cytochrome c biogenesis permease subunit